MTHLEQLADRFLDGNHLRWLARAFGNPHFVPLTSRDLESLDAACTIETFGTGARLYRQGEPADSCFLIRSGTVRLEREASLPRTVGISELGEGQVAGDHAMFGGTVHSSTAVALTPVEAVRFSREQTIDALAMHPSRVALRWLLSALETNHRNHDRIAILLSGTVRSRVATYLLSRDADVVELTHECLAELVGAERASVTRAVGALRDEGLLTNGRGVIEVLDREGLEAVAGTAK